MDLLVPVRRNTALLAVLALVASLFVANGVATPSAAIAAAVATERAPDITWGGRTVAVTIDPEDANHVLAASESGGMYETFDAGASWSRVQGMPQHRLVDLRFHPSNGSIVIATAVADSRAGAGGGGIWRSADGGTTWTQPPGANVCSRSAAAGIAWERSGDGTVVVATECGVMVSTDSGGTWAQTTPGGGYESSVTADRDGSGNLIISTCGQNGFQRSTDGGANWTTATIQPNSPECLNRVWAHSLQTSPYDPNIIWAAFLELNAARTQFTGPALYESRDGGATWSAVYSQTNINRPPFVTVHESASGDPTEVDVFWGNGVRTFLETCDGSSTAASCAGAGTQIGEDHADQIDVAYPAGSNCATFMASDGGVHSSADCGANWTITGGSGDGFGALQIYDMALQAHPTHTDLYFGTQDNLLWASPDGGATWPTNVTAEGFFLDVPAIGDDSHDNSIVTGVRCAACSNFRTAEHFSGLAAWNDPVASGGGNPYLVKEGWYAQVADATPADMDPTLSVFLNDNVDDPASWVNKLDLVDGSGNPYNMRGRAIFAGPVGDPVMYHPYRDATGNEQLLRITGLLTSATPTITEINAFGDLGSYCNGQGTFVCPNVFGVNPSDADHIIAIDAGPAMQALQSRDGGVTWTPDSGLTAAITDNGTYRFAATNGGGSQAHTIKFDPANPDRILIGTEQAGIVASYDGGTTWGRVAGSEEIPAISDIEFDQIAGDIWISSYGRGLWTIELPEVDLSVTKTHRPESPIAGEEVLYDITVENAGPDIAETVQVTDVLPVQVSYVTTTLGTNGDGCAVTGPGDGTSVGETVVCDVGTLAPTDSVTFTIRGFVAADTVSDAGGPVTVTNNVAVSTVSATDIDDSNDSDTDSAIIVDSADLEIAKACDDEVHAGETAQCTITVDNEGSSDARGVVATDVLSSDTSTFVIVSATPSQGSCTISGGDTVECELGTLEASSTTETGRATVVVEVTADDGQTIENLATVRADTPDPNDTNDQAAGSISVTAVADLALTSLTSSPGTVVAGQDVTWSLSATNNGPSTARNAVIEVSIPAGVHLMSATTSDGGACTLGTPGDPSDPIVCGLDDLTSGDADGVTITATVDAGTVDDLTVSASISSDTLDLDDGNDLAQVVTAVTTSSDVAVTSFTATPDPVVAGTPITYSATITTGGPSVARDVVVTIALPAEVDYATATVVAPATGTCAPTTESADTVACALGDLAPGSELTVSIQGDVQTSADPGTIVASATASSPTPDPAAGNDSADATTTVVTEADAHVVLSGPAIYKPSTTVRLTVEVHNSGPSDSRGGVVEITLPSGRNDGEYRGTDGPCTESGGTVTCTIPTLAPDEQTVFTFDFYVQGNSKRIVFDAALTTSTSDPNLSNNTSHVEMDTR